VLTGHFAVAMLATVITGFAVRSADRVRQQRRADSAHPWRQALRILKVVGRASRCAPEIFGRPLHFIPCLGVSRGPARVIPNVFGAAIR
jgi:hypothetical protein